MVSEAVQVRLKIGTALQEVGLDPKQSGLELLRLQGSLYGLSRRETNRRIEELEHLVDIGDAMSRLIGTYSGGMKRRLDLAASLIHAPEVLFLDEPTDGLDPVSTETIHSLIRAATQTGTTVFLTTHDMVEADKLSDRVAFLNQGKIVALDTPARLKQRFGMRALKVEVELPNGDIEVREVTLDEDQTPQTVFDLFKNERILTVHSEEATLEDIFFDITGRGLQG